MAVHPAPAALLAATLCLALPPGATPASASTPLEAAVLIAPERDSESYQEVELNRFWGVGLAWWLSDAWAVEARGQFQDGDGDFRDVSVDGFDLGLRRSLPLGERWRPYLAAGAHYRDTAIQESVACLDLGDPCPPLRYGDAGRGGFLGAGIDWSFFDRAALRFDGRYRAFDSSRLGGTETEGTVAVGVAFRF